VTRYGIYGIPGVGGAPADAVALRDAADRWYAKRPDITVDARRYGFHLTLKAPFTLGEGIAPTALASAMTRFAESRPPVPLRALRVQALGAFRALVPTGPTAEIDALAADAVRTFEPFRAPLTRAEVARRRPERLTERQRALLNEYGYPYVLDEFRAHLTLTDAMTGVEDAADAALAEHFAPFDGGDSVLTSVALVVEPATGAPFGIHSLHPFGKAAA